MKNVTLARIVLNDEYGAPIEIIDDFFTSENLKYIQNEEDYNTLCSSFKFYEKKCAVFRIISLSDNERTVIYSRIAKSNFHMLQRYKTIIRSKFIEHFNIPEVKEDKYGFTYLITKDSSGETYRCSCKDIPELDAEEGYRTRAMSFTAMKKSVLNYLINIGLREVRNK